MKDLLWLPLFCVTEPAISMGRRSKEKKEKTASGKMVSNIYLATYLNNVNGIYIIYLHLRACTVKMLLCLVALVASCHHSDVYHMKCLNLWPHAIGLCGFMPSI